MKRFLIGLIFYVGLAPIAWAQQDRASAALTQAMAQVADRNWDGAAAKIAPAGQIGRDIVEWHRLRAGAGRFSDYMDFLTRRNDWPGLPLLAKMGEPSILASADPGDVIKYFAEQGPQTGTGALRLAAALSAVGKGDAAKAEIVKAWRTLSLGKAEQAWFLGDYGPLLVNHHRARQDMLIWRGLLDQAVTLNGLVGSGYKALAQARIGLLKNAKGVDGLIKAVPKSLIDHPGLAYARFKWRLKNRQQAGAVALMLSQSTSAKELGNPNAWAGQRRSMARNMMRSGKMKTAYRLAANHYVESGDNFIDLEWLAGFIALRGLKDPAKALEHFKRFRAGVDTPISLGRAGYWEGRALEALNSPEAAQLAYEFGAEFQTSFYGQLAAEKAGLPMDPMLIGDETYPDFHSTPHGNDSVLQAALLFHGAGYPLLFTRFIRHLAEVLDTQEQGALAQLALDLEEPYGALYLAKYAAKSGVVLMRPYYPLPDITKPGMDIPAELTLAIARRESEFYTRSISPVGARGLMQLMPKTAKEMARKIGVGFKLERLIEDPAYNAALGSAYLAELMQDFGGYYPYVAAGYNAGPSRPKKWRKLFGDPKRSVAAAVDWIEFIPFRETRNYVMRVTESLAVYRARLSGKVSKPRLSQVLLGR